MYFVPSLELGPGYSIFYLKVCLFDLLNLLFMKFYFICCGLFFPKPPLYVPSSLQSEITGHCFLLIAFLKSWLPFRKYKQK